MKEPWSKSKAYRTYCEWWLGKKVHLPYAKEGDEKRVVNVEVFDPPSFVYGGATLYFKDGTHINLPDGDAFRPRKKDLIVVKECNE